MTKNESHLDNVIDVSKLDLRLDNLIGSSAKINKIGNTSLSKSVALFDIYVTSDFKLNLLSVHKQCKRY